MLGDGDSELGLERIVGGGRGQVAALEQVERTLDGDVGSFLGGKLVVLPAHKTAEDRSGQPRPGRGERGRSCVARTYVHGNVARRGDRKTLFIDVAEVVVRLQVICKDDGQGMGMKAKGPSCQQDVPWLVAYA